MSKGIKYDNGKLRWSLLPIKVMREVIKVLMHGAKKYKPDNWKYVEPWDKRYYNSTKRHLNDWWLGYKNDGDEIEDKEERKEAIKKLDKSGYHHLAHAICCLIFLLWGDMNKDRTQIGD